MQRVFVVGEWVGGVSRNFVLLWSKPGVWPRTRAMLNNYVGNAKLFYIYLSERSIENVSDIYLYLNY